MLISCYDHILTEISYFVLDKGRRKPYMVFAPVAGFAYSGGTNMSRIAFDHVHVISRNPAAAARWYVDVFDGTIVQETEMRGAPHIVVDISGVSMLIRGQRPGENPSDVKPLKH
jgi:hypothetical protein